MLEGNKPRDFMRRALAGALIGSSCVLFFLIMKSSHGGGISWQSRDEAANSIPSQPEVMQLVIKPREDSTRDNLVINVTVINISKEPIGWDSEFSCFLGWMVWTPKHYGLPLRESPTRIEQTQESLGRRRFVYIAPGDRLSRDIVITSPFRAFRYEGGGDGDFDHPPEPRSGYEILTWFELPKRHRGFSIQMGYDGYASIGAFRQLFGFDPKEAKIWTGNCSANVLDIKIND
jgi:hypothetical protein